MGYTKKLISGSINYFDSLLGNEAKYMYFDENGVSVSPEFHVSSDVFDMPYCGKYIILGRNNYLFCNNTRHQFRRKAPEGNHFPVKLKSHCPTDPSLLNQNTVQNVIDQVYQFRRHRPQ